MRLSMPDIFGIKAIRELKKNRRNEFDENIRNCSAWIENSKEFSNLGDDSKVMLIRVLNNLEFATMKMKERKM